MVKSRFSREFGAEAIKPPMRFREQEEFLRFPSARPEGPLGLPSEVKALGYKVRFTEEIWGGYRINVLREDGSALARGLKIGGRFLSPEKSVTDGDNEIALRLRLNFPAVLRVTLSIGSEELTPESFKEAIEGLSYPDSFVRMESALLLARAAGLGYDMAGAVPELGTMLAHGERGVRVDAAFALAEYAKAKGDLRGAESGLVQAARHADGRTRRAAARALMQHYINQGDGQGMELMLGHPIKDVRLVASYVRSAQGEAADKD